MWTVACHDQTQIAVGLSILLCPIVTVCIEIYFVHLILQSYLIREYHKNFATTKFTTTMVVASST